MTYLREVCDLAVDQLPSEHLERYIMAYEKGLLGCRSYDHCAVGRMMGSTVELTRPLGQGLTEEQARFFNQLRCYKSTTRVIREQGLDAPALTLIEAVFEGHLTALGVTSSLYVKPEDRRRIIYDSCIEELARRDSLNGATHEPHEEAVPEHATSGR